MRAPRITLGLAISATLVACSMQLAPPGSPPDNSSLPSAVTPASLPTRAVTATTTVSADGVVQTASAPIALGAAIDAKIASVNAEPGQRVKRGEVLATLDSTSLRDALEDAKLQLTLTEAQIAQNRAPANPADLDSAKAALTAAQLQYDRERRGPTPAEIEEARLGWEAARANYLAAQVNRDVYCGAPGQENSIGCKAQEASYGSTYESERAALDRYQSLLQPVTKEKVQQSYAAVVQARARVQSLESGLAPEQQNVFDAQLNQARSAVTRAEANLRETVVSSPCDCVVQEVNLSVGAVPKGVAITLINLGALQFKTTNLTERELADVSVGLPAQVRLRALDEALTGTVTAIVPQSAGAQGSAALFTVLVTLDRTANTAAVLPGMTGRVDVNTASR